MLIKAVSNHFLLNVIKENGIIICDYENLSKWRNVFL